MKFKPGVKIAGVRPEMIAVMFASDSAHKELFGEDATITAVKDGKHKTDRHSKGYGVDVRTRYPNGEQFSEHDRREFAGSIRARLTDEFDVVEESDHIHIELDKRAGVG